VGLVAPAARNPYQREMSAGGSSAGAAVAVAAGLVAVAHGSDGGGSLRIPAAICAVVGVKPSRGVIPGGPFGFGGFGLPTHGPIARTVADAAAMLDAMAVPGLGEPYPAPPLPPGGHLAAIRRPPRRLRVGWFVTPMLAEVDVDPACRAAVQMAAEALAEAGHDLREIAAPVTPDVAGWFETVWSALSLAPVPPDREDRLLPLTRYLRERGRAAGTSGLLAALGALQGVVRSAQRALHDVDVLLCPTLARPQVPVGWFTARGDPAWDFEEQKRFSPYCAIINLLGGPAVSVPCGASAAKLTGAWGSDATVLAVAAELEQRLPWSARHPPQWAPVGSVTVDRSHGSP
jgi:amidase